MVGYDHWPQPYQAEDVAAIRSDWEQLQTPLRGVLPVDALSARVSTPRPSSATASGLRVREDLLRNLPYYMHSAVAQMQALRGTYPRIRDRYAHIETTSFHGMFARNKDVKLTVMHLYAKTILPILAATTV